MRKGDQRVAKAYSQTHVYDADEEEFIKAMADFIKKTKHRFPTWTECLGVLKSLGYRKTTSDSKGRGADGQDDKGPASVEPPNA